MDWPPGDGACQALTLPQYLEAIKGKPHLVGWVGASIASKVGVRSGARARAAARALIRARQNGGVVPAGVRAARLSSHRTGTLAKLTTTNGARRLCTRARSRMHERV